MPISMWVRKEMPERGDRLDEGSVPWRVSRSVLNPRDTPLLVGVDPYGHTVFKRLQVEQLPREVEYLRRELGGTTEGKMLDELERLMALVTERVHRYLWFVGD